MLPMPATHMQLATSGYLAGGRGFLASLLDETATLAGVFNAFGVLRFATAYGASPFA